mmetsp:Transcript_8644/g.24865  ORF Transcript_8644/g.24865 Transcript_8644/m.24865 type:complete len:218 (+) Transcript_8644:110-763(+)
MQFRVSMSRWLLKSHGQLQQLPSSDKPASAMATASLQFKVLSNPRLESQYLTSIPRYMISAHILPTTLPESWVPLTSNNSSWVNDWNSSGMVPSTDVHARSSLYNSTRFPSSDGIVPLKFAYAKLSSVNLVSIPSSVGSVPVVYAPFHSSRVNIIKCPISVGREPTIRVLGRSKTSSAVRWPMPSGMVESQSVAPKSNLVNDGKSPSWNVTFPDSLE